MKALIVLPTYEEAGNVGVVLRRLRAEVPGADVLVVDDSSPDGTGTLATEVGAELGGIEVMSRPRKQGLGSAYRDGFAWGLERGYEAMVEMDADLSHDPGAVPSLLQALEDGADLVLGSRYVRGGAVRGWSRHRHLLSAWGNRYASMMLGLPLSDVTSGFRAYRSDLIRRACVDTTQSNGYCFQIEMVRRVAMAGGVVTEIPITFAERRVGRSKMSFPIVVEALTFVTLWRLQAMAGMLPGSDAR